MFDIDQFSRKPEDVEREKKDVYVQMYQYRIGKME